MRELLKILTLLTISLAGYSQPDLYCNRPESISDSMTRAWYPYQIVDSLRFEENIDLIIADQDIKPLDFISSIEITYRRLASREPKPEKYIHSAANFRYNDYDSYLKDYWRETQYWDSLAVIEHKYSNGMDMAIWIQNSSSDTIHFPMQDGSLIALLEAIDNNDNWRPIEYWWFSCYGYSYSDLLLLPNHSIQIGINNQLGEIITKMRFKVRGRDTLYTSNVFLGYISLNKFKIPYEVIHEIFKDKYRVSFLDTVHFGLTNFPDELDILIFEE